MILGRLLDPKDFGLVGMVTAVIGVLNLFRDFGLSTATVQRPTVTQQQLSTLFWINVLVGALLGILSLAMAPVLAAFYHDPRIVGVTSVLAAGFLFNGAAVQHSALLQRQMRFTTLATIDTASLLVSSATGILMAIGGWGYWALVGMMMTAPVVSSVWLWAAAAWVPGRPQREAGVHSMVRFGGAAMLNGLIVYIAYNLEKVLLGRFWGAEALGVYGRAYQLINIPTDNIISATSGVAFAALSRLQDDLSRLKGYFMKGYSLALALTLPITIACALFADDLILALLGPKWKDAITIFRLLAPTILIFAVINPLGWLLYSIGLIRRSLKIALVIALLVITGYIVGLPYGPKGVALGYSIAMALWVVPHIAWCIHGTIVSFRDILNVLSRPFSSSITAAALAYGARVLFGEGLSPLPKLMLESAVLFGAYVVMLLYFGGQKAFYLELLRGLRGQSTAEENSLASA